MLKPENRSTRFRGFPKNDQGEEVPISDFRSMPQSHLRIWQQHILKSYSKTPPKNKFRVLDRLGNTVTLSGLAMGDDGEAAVKKSKNAPKTAKNGTAKAKPRTKAGKRGKKLIAVEEAEAVSSDNSDKDDIVSKDPNPAGKKRKHVGDNDDWQGSGAESSEIPPPTKKKQPRAAAKAATAKAAKQARLLASRSP